MQFQLKNQNVKIYLQNLLIKKYIKFFFDIIKKKIVLINKIKQKKKIIL